MHDQFNREVLRPEFLIEMFDVVEGATLDLFVTSVEMHDDTVRSIYRNNLAKVRSPSRWLTHEKCTDCDPE
jgi:hypothetical protein